jgi:predicted RNA-binding protein with PIN domain
MAEPTLYLFDGSNLFHAGEFADREELVNVLASFVAARGVRGVVAFDGHGADRDLGPLAVRYAPHADDVLERLAAEHRRTEAVVVVTSDAAVRGTAGQEVRKQGSRAFLAELESPRHREHEQAGAGGRVGDRLDPKTREALERLRRGGSGG